MILVYIFNKKFFLFINFLNLSVVTFIVTSYNEYYHTFDVMSIVTITFFITFIENS